MSVNAARKSSRHYDGPESQQELEADPDLANEVEIDLPRANTRTRTATSGKSNRTTQSNISKKSDVKDRSNVVLSRGRPMKAHETEPFLSIDNLPPEKTFVSEKTPRTPAGPPKSQAKSPYMPSQHERMSAYMSPYSRTTPGPPSSSVISGNSSSVADPLPSSSNPRPSLDSRPNTDSRSSSVGKPRSVSPGTKGSRPSTGKSGRSDSAKSGDSRRGTGSRPGTGSRVGSRLGFRVDQTGYRSSQSRTGRITPANTPYRSPTKQLRTPNHHVKSPFKHSVGKPEMVPEGRQTPSQGLKERTALAAYHVNKMMMLQSDQDQRRAPGKLQKGKLKPLYPVNVDGPSINMCRGIVSETRSYASSPSRTLQRRLHLMSTIPNVHEYLYERPRTVESVHQTSEASSIDDNIRDEFSERDLQSDRSLPDEIIYRECKSPPAPENTFIPMQCDEDFAQGPADLTPRMFATELNGNEGDTDPKHDKTDVTVSDQLQQEPDLSYKQDTNGPKGNSVDNNDNANALIDTEEGSAIRGDRPSTHSASTRIGSPSKSVRFADDKARSVDSQDVREIRDTQNVSPMKQQKDRQGSGDLKKKVKRSGSKDSLDNIKEKDENTDKNKINATTCKDEGIKKDFKKDDDKDGDDHSDKNKENNSRTASASKVGSARKGSGKATSDNKSCNGNNDGQKRSVNMNSSGQGHEANSKIVTARKQMQKSLNQSHRSRPASAGSGSGNRSSRTACAKFDKSPASKPHTPKLQVSSTLHGASVNTSLRPESPCSRSPTRQAALNQARSQAGFDMDFDSYWRNEQSFLDGDEDIEREYHHKSKVKFMLDGEPDEVETIFVGEDDDVRLRSDRDITFECIESELAAVMATIQSNARNNVSGLPENIEDEDESDANSSNPEVSELTSETETEAPKTETDVMDSIRGDYHDLLDKYRQRCMERSETYGAISLTLVTPRNVGSTQSAYTLSADLQQNAEHPDPKSECVTNTMSDSGRGSVSNLSDFSRTQSDIPRLDLGSMSDLGLDTSCSDETITEMERGECGADSGAEEDDRNILQIVCDQLPESQQSNKKLESKKETEEDVSKLKVVATTKSISKSKQQKTMLSAGEHAPFPPLCFTINARPPQGYLYYFAYGPDMNPNRFSNYIMREITDRYWGLLFGFNLVFNKKGSSEEAGGFANLEFNPVRSVEGCLYKITQGDLSILDKCVGYPQHYEHLMLPVWLSNSVDPDSVGVAQHCVPALTYIAQDAWTETEKELPCDYALSQCIKSADMVTTEYKNALVAMATPTVTVNA